MKEKKIWIRILIQGLILIAIVGFVYYLVGCKNLKSLQYSEEYVKAPVSQVTPRLTEKTVINQRFINHADILEGITLKFATYDDSLIQGDIQIVLNDSEENELYYTLISVTELQDNEEIYIGFTEKINMDRDKQYSLKISEINNNDGNVASLWAGDSQEDCELFVNGEKVNYTLYFDLKSSKDGKFNLCFSLAIIIFTLMFILFCLYQQKKEIKGVKSGISECVHIFDEYGFLLKQLIGRDFAIKYRRSYLGVVWVILNPLFTMIVLSAVFSFIFRFNIENFPVYLILGQVVFNFFNEATQVSLSTITGSGQMIKKIYVPKYIFPLSKTMFSFVNFVLTFIPVILVMMYYRIPLTINIVYLPTLLISFFFFTLGVSFVLSALEVFMRDTQYLYGIFMTLMGYISPIFYPVSSLSPLFQKVMLLNPLYHYMNVLREILLYGQTPTVQQMSMCIIIGITFLGFGVSYFFKKQNKFILYI